MNQSSPKGRLIQANRLRKMNINADFGNLSPSESDLSSTNVHTSPSTSILPSSPYPTVTRRLVGKRGDVRVVSKNVPHKVKLYASDLFTTVIDLRWHWVLLLFVLSYIVSWLLFAVIWWMIVHLRGIGVCFENVSSSRCTFRDYTVT